MRSLLLAAVAAVTLTGVAPTAAAAAPPPPPIRHVFVIVLENKSYAETFGPGSKAPYLATTLPALGKLLPNYYGIGHQSLDNYVAMVSGQAPNPVTQADCQFYTDVVPGTAGPGGQALGQGCVYPTSTATVADQLSAAGRTWAGFMQDMGNDPAREAKTCAHPALDSQDKTQSATATDSYATRHDPFVYFHSVIDRPACATSVVPLTALPAALAAGTAAPALSFITPSLCDDGHDSPCADGRPGGLVTVNQFLAKWVPQILGSPAFNDNGMLVVTFDEAESTGAAADASACCGEGPGPNSPLPGISGLGGGRVGAVVVSPFTRPGTTDTTAYNHYGLLRTVEDVFGLAPLGNAATVAGFGADVFDGGTTAVPASPPPPPPPASPPASSPRAALPTTGSTVPDLALVAGASALALAILGRRRRRAEPGKMKPAR